MYVYHIGLRIEMIVPDIFQQHGAGDDMPGIAHEVFQQLELAGLQGNILAGARYGAGEQVNFKVDRLEFGFQRLLGAAPAQAFNTGEKLGEGVGFRQVIIATGAKALHPLVHIAQGAENENRSGDALGSAGCG